MIPDTNKVAILSEFRFRLRWTSGAIPVHLQSEKRTPKKPE